MIKRIAAWITALIRAELDRLESSYKKDALLILQKLESIQTAFDTSIADIKKHVSDELQAVSASIEEKAAAQIHSNFEKILSVTSVAAKEALADARRVLRMPCDACKLMSWKFTVAESGRVICHDCQIKGAK